MCRHRLIFAAALIGCASFASFASFARAEDAKPAPKDVLVGPDGFRITAEKIEIPLPQREKGAFLGVATSGPSPVLREQLKLSAGMGLVVDVVEKGSPAEQAGIKQYDVLTKLGDQMLVNAEQLAVLVRSHKPGEEIELTVVRGGTPTVMKAKLVERELAPLEDLMFFRGMPGGARGAADFWRDHPGAVGENVRQWVFPPADRKGGPVSRSTTVWTDGEYTLTITSGPDAPERRLVAKDKSGAVLFDGDLDALGTREKLPAIVAEKLQKMESAGVKPPKPDAKRSGKGDVEKKTPSSEGTSEVKGSTGRAEQL